MYHQTRGNYLSHFSVIICHGYRGNLKPRTATQQGQKKPQISVLRSWKRRLIKSRKKQSKSSVFFSSLSSPIPASGKTSVAQAEQSPKILKDRAFYYERNCDSKNWRKMCFLFLLCPFYPKLLNPSYSINCGK